MNLETLNANEIRKSSLQVAQAGRENLVLLLQHLRVIEHKRLFSSYGFKSLFDYVVRELKFSEPEAQRRISTMRLMRDVPSIINGLRDGSLSMTNLCLVQTLLLKEKKAGRMHSAHDIVDRVRGKSSRQAMKIVAEINPEMNRTTALTYDSIESDELREKVQRVRGLFAHIDPNMSFEELLGRLCDQALEPKSPSAPKVDSEADIKRRVWARDGGQCTKCESTHAIQFDHIIPCAVGGETTYENLRLLCRNCNLRAAMDAFGERKMTQFLRDVERPYAWQFSSCA